MNFTGFRFAATGELLVEYCTAVPVGSIRWQGLAFNQTTGALYVRGSF